MLIGEQVVGLVPGMEQDRDLHHSWTIRGADYVPQNYYHCRVLHRHPVHRRTEDQTRRPTWRPIPESAPVVF